MIAELPPEGDRAPGAQAFELDRGTFAAIQADESGYRYARLWISSIPTTADADGVLALVPRADIVGWAVIARGCAWKVVAQSDLSNECVVELEAGADVKFDSTDGTDVSVWAKPATDVEPFELGFLPARRSLRVNGLDLGVYEFGFRSGSSPIRWTVRRMLVPGNSFAFDVPPPADRSLRIDGRVRKADRHALECEAIAVTLSGVDSHGVPAYVRADVVADAPSECKFTAELPREGYYCIRVDPIGWKQLNRLSFRSSHVEVVVPDLAVVLVRVRARRSAEPVAESTVSWRMSPQLEGAGGVGRGGVVQTAAKVSAGLFRILCPEGTVVIEAGASGFETQAVAVNVRATVEETVTVVLDAE